MPELIIPTWLSKQNKTYINVGRWYADNIAPSSKMIQMTKGGF